MTTVYTTHPRYTEHDQPTHPEHAGRIRAVWARLEESGLRDRMQAVDPVPVSDDLILTVHTPDYLDLLERVSAQSRQMHLDADTYAGHGSLEIARLSAGGAVAAVDAVLRGAASNGLAAVRPPGHHAMPDHGMGFCLLGNIAIAARYAQRQYGLERVLIVDYDVHHGNGTEAMFYNDPSVLFISLHQYPLYPGTGEATDIGAGKGTGFNINVPLPPNCGDGNYLHLFEQIVLKAAERFAPELILVSAGFDAHWADPLAGMRVSLPGYAAMTSALVRLAERLCGGKIVFVMEGGYNLDALSFGVCNIARVLLGDQPTDPMGLSPSKRPEPDVAPLLELLRRLHKLD
jgi:acetoin utilization deacetylase AcuC-like enzyme